MKSNKLELTDLIVALDQLAIFLAKQTLVFKAMEKRFREAKDELDAAGNGTGDE